MEFITSLPQLQALYGTPGQAAQMKVMHHLVPTYRQFVERSRFCVLTTVGPGGTDGTPRGDAGPVVTVLDDRTLALPDWRGNDRIDSLTNIVVDGRVSLIFLIPGSTNAMRVNGTARLTVDGDLRDQLARGGTRPRSVIVITIAEVYPQCARALIRSELWTNGDASQGLPSIGAMLAEVTSGAFDGAAYDAEWPGRAAKTMW
jgi:PPOX class probable FMN-dependent enzyme